MDTGGMNLNNEHNGLLTLSKYQKLYIILSALFLTNALLAEVIGVKIFSLEQYLNVPPAHISLGKQWVLDFNLTAGVVIWPFVFITSDLINEYFGKSGLKRISYLTAACIVYAFVMILWVTDLPPAEFWLQVNSKDTQGNPLNINAAFSTIFRQGMGIIAGSLTAFLVGQLIDTYIFHAFKKWTGSKHLWLRATGSTLFSQLIDSYLVLYIAFYAFGNWPIEQVLAIGTMNYLYKFLIAILLTPVIYLGHFGIDAYLKTSPKDNYSIE